jgi:Domain of unknown function (DUF4168)
MFHSVLTTGMSVSPRFAKSLAIVAFSTLSLCSGFAPSFSTSSLQWFDAAAQAQTEESALTRYVRAAYEIEQTRRSMVEEVKKMTAGNMPSNVCQPRSLEQLQTNIREQVKGICANFRTQADSIVKKHKLTREEFNAFQKRSQEADLSRQIESEIRRLRFQ